MAKQMQQQTMYPEQRLYCDRLQDPKVKHIWESFASDQ